jgi:hypothetical protein
MNLTSVTTPARQALANSIRRIDALAVSTADGLPSAIGTGTILPHPSRVATTKRLYALSLFVATLHAFGQVDWLQEVPSKPGKQKQVPLTQSPFPEHDSGHEIIFLSHKSPSNPEKQEQALFKQDPCELHFPSFPQISVVQFGPAQPASQAHAFLTQTPCFPQYLRHASISQDIPEYPELHMHLATTIEELNLGSLQTPCPEQEFGHPNELQSTEP